VKPLGPDLFVLTLSIGADILHTIA